MSVRIIVGDVRAKLAELRDESVNAIVTSPPYYGLRSYLPDGHPDKVREIGLEKTPSEYVAALVAVFRDARRVLRSDGTLWLNLGDSYANDGKWGGSTGGKHAVGNHGSTGIGRGRKSTGLKPKDLIGIPWRVAFALQDDGWYLRQDIIWSKPNPMPESVTDRCTKAHEYLFLLSKSARYYFDAEAIAENAIGLSAHDLTGPSYQAPGQTRQTGTRKRGVPPRHAKYESSDQSGLDGVGRGGRRNKRSVWTVATAPFPELHFATFPPALIEPCILAACPEGGTVMDTFFGSGTTGMVADRLGRNCIGIDLSGEYTAIAERRINADAGMFAKVAAE